MTVLDDTLAAFRRWLHLPDVVPLLAVLGTVAANRLDGDPVWLLLVGSPSSGKSEILQAVGSLPDVFPTASLTEGGLLSGTPKREKANGASGGLLRRIGDQGIILAKDFGSILSLHHDLRAQVLAALREIFDGSWTRNLGTDGGQSMHWEGKVGLVAGCTPTIDRHHAVMGAMGERFVLVRLSPTDAHDQARKALAHSKQSAQMRAELSSAVAVLFAQPTAAIPERTEHELERLANLAVLVVRCRSAVERDGYTREVELIPEPEAPARLVIVLDRLLDGLLSIGTDQDTAWRVVEAAGLDCIPALRRTVMEKLVTAREPLTVAQIAEAIGYPKKTTERTLDDLVAHGVAVVHRDRPGKQTTWQASDWTAKSWAAATSPEKPEDASATSPEKSGGVSSIGVRTHTDDLSGEVGAEARAELSANDSASRLQRRSGGSRASATASRATPSEASPRTARPRADAEAAPRVALYRAWELADVFARYLPSQEPQQALRDARALPTVADVADAAVVEHPLRAVDCAQPDRHAARHRPHPSTGRIVCNVCHPPARAA